ncbi:MAG: hypothetical protein QM755_17135 [Luteolibacter sp.]
MNRALLPVAAGVLGLVIGCWVIPHFRGPAAALPAASSGSRPDIAKYGDVDSELAELVKAHVPADWKIMADANRIIVSPGSVKYFHLVSAGRSPESEESWVDAPVNDFIIEIRSAPRMSDEEFESLRKWRQVLLETRISQTDSPGGKMNGKSLWEMKCQVARMVPLPFCHDSNQSLYFYSSDEGLAATRPASAVETAKALRAALGKIYTRYLLTAPEKDDPTEGF